jgi:hypothetical protein
MVNGSRSDSIQTLENPINRWILRRALLVCLIIFLSIMLYSLIRGNLVLGFTISLAISSFMFYLICWHREFWLRPINLEFHKDYFIAHYRYGRKSRSNAIDEVSQIATYGSLDDPDNDVILEFIDGKWYRIKKPVAYTFGEKYGLKINRHDLSD